MTYLFSKDEDMMASPPILGYSILRYMKKQKVTKISIFDVADKFSAEKWFSTKNLYFAMLFLFSVGLIEFNKTYITLHAQNS